MIRKDVSQLSPDTGDLAYHTVTELMKRLVDKGIFTYEECSDIIIKGVGEAYHHE